MTVEPNTIFPDPPEQLESEKISFWLKKLFEQQEQIRLKSHINDADIGEKWGIQSLSTSLENKSPPMIFDVVKSPEEKGIDEHIQHQAQKENTTSIQSKR